MNPTLKKVWDVSRGTVVAVSHIGGRPFPFRLGHTDDQTMKNDYLHVTEEIKKEAPHKFTQLMRSFFRYPLCCKMLVNHSHLTNKSFYIKGLGAYCLAPAASHSRNEDKERLLS
ncbi:hypothetical protein JOC95_004086 [Bacillus tianshenii]|uniref:Uncharacterized protein n=1 Tax=Sutcliffiella tianshenii TaxID=1463404 RepID=A0ABS2P6Y6_9BACI|nr:hypothetical protein [Bacillus tianshenii]